MRAGTAETSQAADPPGDLRADRARIRAHSRHTQQRRGWTDDQLPPVRHRCYWGCRGECRTAPPVRDDGDARGGGTASDDTDDGSDSSTDDAATPSKRRRVDRQRTTPEPRPPRRTRRTDTLLQLRAPARLALRERLADADARRTGWNNTARSELYYVLYVLYYITY